MTNKIYLKSVDEFMKGYTPVYSPVYPLFLGKAQAWAMEAGEINFKRIDTVGNIRGQRITPKDTVMAQVNAKQASKTFKKYFFANQYTNSNIQSSEGVEDVLSQVLDECQKHQDDLFLLGEGTSSSTMINNGLFWSGDANYVLHTSDETLDGAQELHTSVMKTVAEADLVSGRKVILFYGEDCLPIFDSVYESAPTPFKVVLQQVLGSNYSLAKIPADVTPADENGWIIANLDQVKLNYTKLPSLLAQGVNEEKMYSWHNTLYGSMMLECLVPGAVIRQEASLGM